MLTSTGGNSCGPAGMGATAFFHCILSSPSLYGRIPSSSKYDSGAVGQPVLFATDTAAPNLSSSVTEIEAARAGTGALAEAALVGAGGAGDGELEVLAEASAESDVAATAALPPSCDPSSTISSSCGGVASAHSAGRMIPKVGFLHVLILGFSTTGSGAFSSSSSFFFFRNGLG